MVYSRLIFQTRVSPRQLQRSGLGLASCEPQPRGHRWVSVCHNGIVCNSSSPDPGWGSTATGGGSSNKLRQASVPMVTQAKCSQAYSAISRVTIGETKVGLSSLSCHHYHHIMMARYVRVTGPGTRVTVTPEGRCWPPSWAESGPWWGWPASGWTAPGQTSRECTPGEWSGRYQVIITVIILDRVDKYLPWIRQNMWELKLRVSTNQQQGQNNPNDPMNIFLFLRQKCHLINKPENKQLKNPINSFILEKLCRSLRTDNFMAEWYKVE